jgi:hypothetical protein
MKCKDDIIAVLVGLGIFIGIPTIFFFLTNLWDGNEDLLFIVAILLCGILLWAIAAMICSPIQYLADLLTRLFNLDQRRLISCTLENSLIFFAIILAIGAAYTSYQFNKRAQIWYYISTWHTEFEKIDCPMEAPRGECFVTKLGAHYHSSTTCEAIKNMQIAALPRKIATSRREPCPNCYPQEVFEDKDVYITAFDSLYHSNADCGNIHDCYIKRIEFDKVREYHCSEECGTIKPIIREGEDVSLSNTPGTWRRYPCDYCFDAKEGRPVYISPSDPCYHSDSNCRWLRDCFVKSIDLAELKDVQAYLEEDIQKPPRRNFHAVYGEDLEQCSCFNSRMVQSKVYVYDTSYHSDPNCTKFRPLAEETPNDVVVLDKLCKCYYSGVDLSPCSKCIRSKE